ncbi:branched-chain amino acid transport [Paucilactobacillus vaccinostercus DSM 20634]|jgi:branched-subunit amino acid transport protein|uniref:Branched-chain amino acid transport n=1 Tax=Paucilactobacillus vaccinostercus DSM 20634 TaxID=1423813 RepID=A0A0R2A494_9LACO|nr:AzlD domain-containing protein [Paucilactobacillus vaccinostercus]KRM61306.1 branched-chain amino acid transport [Paucilactobacillus vaccinostercus DSM 20634]RRG08183.1 MAG: AzlD domain-containing protein [Lactobacillus sp.]
MPSSSFILLTIVGCGLATWLSRVAPFIILKKYQLSPAIIEFLSFVPIVIMAALWFENLFHQNLGHLPSINYENFFASIPTVIGAVITKSLLVIVVIGIISLAVVRWLM